jgi:hypothetical protein
VTPTAAWYGSDPIHIRAAAAVGAWRTILSPLLSSPGTAPDIQRNFSGKIQILRVRPELRRMHGRAQHTLQPALRYSDGSTLSLY